MLKQPNCSHYPVMLAEVIKHWMVKKDGFYIDCTFGAGGHTKEFLNHLSENAKLIGIDVDAQSKTFGDQLAEQDKRFSFVNLNFADFFQYWKTNHLPSVHGIFFDLGYSTIQLNDTSRGFSYNQNSELNMTIAQNNFYTASHLLNTANKKDLFNIFKSFADLKNPRKLVDVIGEYRKSRDFETTEDLEAVAELAYPSNIFKNNKNPKKLIYQALRIAVNNELNNLETALNYLDNILVPGGVALFLTFNSLEEKIIKKWIQHNCGHINIPDYAHNISNRFRVLNNKGFLPSQKEVMDNWASRSAKLWVIEKLDSRGKN